MMTKEDVFKLRDNAEQKIYHRLEALGAVKRKRPLIIGVLGCMAERVREELLEKHHADIVCGPDAYLSLPDLILQVEAGNKAINVTELAMIAEATGTTTDALLAAPDEPTSADSLSFMGNVTDPSMLEKINLVRTAIDEIHLLEELLHE